MDIAPFVGVAKMPTGTNAKLPIPARASLPIGTSAKMPNQADASMLGGTSAKLPSASSAMMPSQRISVADRLRRLEEAKAFLRAYLAAGPQPARTLVKAARAAGIATRTLHRAKDALGVRPERSGGYGAHGQWTWYPPEAGGSGTTFAVSIHTLTGERS